MNCFAARRTSRRLAGLACFCAAWLAGGPDRAAAESATQSLIPGKPAPHAGSPLYDEVRCPTIDLPVDDQGSVATWWIPEHIMLGHTDVSVQTECPVKWQLDADDRWAYWSPLGGDRGLASIRVTQIPYGWRGTVTIENRSAETWNNVVAAVCLLLPGSPEFADPQWGRTYYRSGGRYLAYEGRERDGGEGGEGWFQMSLVKDRTQLLRSARHLKKWGFTREPSDDGVIAVQRQDGEAVLVTAWNPTHHLQANRKSTYLCIHANPLFGTLAPGEKKTCSGVVLATPGDLDAAWREALRATASE